MPNCTDRLDQISCLIDNELPEAEREELMRHISECPDCDAFYQACAGLEAISDDDGVQPPEALLKGVMERIESDAAESAAKRARPLRVYITRIAAAAACVALAVAIYPLIRQPKDNATMDGADMAANVRADAQDDAAVAGDAMPPQEYEESLMMTQAEAASESALMAEADMDGGMMYGDAEGFTTGGMEKDYADGYDSAATDAPMDAPEAGAGADRCNSWYAEITVTGALPELIADYELQEQPDGTYYIIISAADAEALMGSGYEGEYMDEAADEAVVVYYPE